jgi:predicted amidohydrolase
MFVSKDISGNENRILKGIEKAAKDKAGFLLTPEGSLSGYRADFEQKEVENALKRITLKAKKLKVGLALGTCFKEKGRCYNQVRVYNPNGGYQGFYAKILRCSSLENPGTGEMSYYIKGTLKTFIWKGLRFGTLICNDLWATPGCTTIPNPYLPWKLKQMGAKVIFHSINSGIDQSKRKFHESSVELWAQSLGIHIVEVNAIHDINKPVNARSGVVGPDGKRIFIAPDLGEQYFSYKIKF